MQNSNRYYQPQNTKDAMRFIERLFNRYHNAPLTMPLIQYHQKLMRQLRTNILPITQRQKHTVQTRDAKRMYRIMNHWLQIRISGHSFPNKMRHFRINLHQQHFKARHIRISGNHHLRSSRH